MRMTSFAAAALALFVSPLFAATPSAKTAGGTIVIVFRDGHRQTFNQADIERIEFPAGDVPVSSSGNLPSRSRFLGKWEAGDGNGGKFTITLWDNGDARRSIGNVHGRWTYVDGEAHILWDDGAKDAIRKTGGRYQKYAYESGKSFTDDPANVTEARNLDQKPL